MGSKVWTGDKAAVFLVGKAFNSIPTEGQAGLLTCQDHGDYASDSNGIIHHEFVPQS
jgi:hypothetical protein